MRREASTTALANAQQARKATGPRAGRGDGEEALGAPDIADPSSGAALAALCRPGESQPVYPVCCVENKQLPCGEEKWDGGHREVRRCALPGTLGGFSPTTPLHPQIFRSMLKERKTSAFCVFRLIWQPVCVALPHRLLCFLQRGRVRARFSLLPCWSEAGLERSSPAFSSHVLI